MREYEADLRRNARIQWNGPKRGRRKNGKNYWMGALNYFFDWTMKKIIEGGCKLETIWKWNKIFSGLGKQFVRRKWRVKWGWFGGGRKRRSSGQWNLARSDGGKKWWEFDGQFNPFSLWWKVNWRKRIERGLSHPRSIKKWRGMGKRSSL